VTAISPAPAAYDDDGIHLTRAAYEKLVPEIADAIKQGGRAMR
jgi:lysophospholipase L1-like esterase